MVLRLLACLGRTGQRKIVWCHVCTPEQSERQEHVYFIYMYLWYKLKKRATKSSCWWLHTAELAVPGGRDFQCTSPLGFSPLQVTLIKPQEPRAARGWN